MGGIPGGQPDLINAAGSSMSAHELEFLRGQSSYGAGQFAHDNPGVAAGEMGARSADPQRQAQMFLNWLTAGGAPKPIEPGVTFAKTQANAPAAQTAARGQGFGGLFGTGSIIGEIAPAPQPIQPLQGLKPLNLSPLQPGVPYSVPAIPKVGR